MVDQAIAQLLWERVSNPRLPMGLLRPEQLEAIHDTSMRIVEELGIEVVHPEACDLLARAGAGFGRFLYHKRCYEV